MRKVSVSLVTYLMVGGGEWEEGGSGGCLSPCPCFYTNFPNAHRHEISPHLPHSSHPTIDPPLATCLLSPKQYIFLSSDISFPLWFSNLPPQYSYYQCYGSGSAFQETSCMDPIFQHIPFFYGFRSTIFLGNLPRTVSFPNIIIIRPPINCIPWQHVSYSFLSNSYYYPSPYKLYSLATCLLLYSFLSYYYYYYYYPSRMYSEPVGLLYAHISPQFRKEAVADKCYPLIFGLEQSSIHYTCTTVSRRYLESSVVLSDFLYFTFGKDCFEFSPPRGEFSQSCSLPLLNIYI